MIELEWWRYCLVFGLLLALFILLLYLKKRQSSKPLRDYRLSQHPLDKDHSLLTLKSSTTSYLILSTPRGCILLEKQPTKESD